MKYLSSPVSEGLPSVSTLSGSDQSNKFFPAVRTLPAEFSPLSRLRQLAFRICVDEYAIFSNRSRGLGLSWKVLIGRNETYLNLMNPTCIPFIYLQAGMARPRMFVSILHCRVMYSFHFLSGEQTAKVEFIC